jgi:hypothetical protein
MRTGRLRGPRIATRIRGRRYPWAGAGITCRQPGVGQRASPRPHPWVSVAAGARRQLRIGAWAARLRPGVGRRTWPRTRPRIGMGTRLRHHPRIGMGTGALRQPRVGMGTGALRQPRVGTGITRLRPGVGRRTWPRTRPRIGMGTRLRRHPRIGMGTGALRHPRIGALRHPRVGTGITRLQPRIGRRTWLWAGERAGSRVSTRTPASGRARTGPPAMAGPAAGITGGHAPPGPGGLLRTSVSHASPLRPAARNPS